MGDAAGKNDRAGYAVGFSGESDRKENCKAACNCGRNQ